MWSERRVTCQAEDSPGFFVSERSLNNKTFVLNDVISSHNLDLFFLTETWLPPGDVSAFSEILPSGYLYLNTPRQTGRGGGIATIHRQPLKCRQLSTKGYSSFEVMDFPISDHSLIRFDISAVPPAPTSSAPHRRRIITSSTVNDFVAAFSVSDLASTADLTSPLCPDHFLASFHTICSQIMDSVAPYKVKSTSGALDPWLNDTTRALRRRCRQAERKWKKDRLQVSLEMFRDSLAAYQRALKEAKGQYLSALINNNSHRPGILFSTINSVINTLSVTLNDVSVNRCNTFKQHFLDKVLSVRQTITQVPAVAMSTHAAQCVLENFDTGPQKTCPRVEAYHLPPRCCSCQDFEGGC
ncbi:RNA-directed DNA polymerase from mobile element jockey-like, partial [Tachysurus ichikawai]